MKNLKRIGLLQKVFESINNELVSQLIVYEFVNIKNAYEITSLDGKEILKLGQETLIKTEDNKWQPFSIAISNAFGSCDAITTTVDNQVFVLQSSSKVLLDIDNALKTILTKDEFLSFKNQFNFDYQTISKDSLSKCQEFLNQTVNKRSYNDPIKNKNSTSTIIHGQNSIITNQVPPEWIKYSPEWFKYHGVETSEPEQER